MTSPIDARELAALRTELEIARHDLALLRRLAPEVALASAAVQTLADFGVGPLPHPHHTWPPYEDPHSGQTKFEEFEGLMADVPEQMREAMWFLATYCFYLTKELAVVRSSAIRELSATRARPRPDIAEQLAAEDRALNAQPAEGPPWRGRALVAARQLKAWYHDVKAAYQALAR